MIDPRRATTEDIPAMAGIINDWIDATGWFPRVHSRAEVEDQVHAAFPAREIWVIGAPVAGYLSVNPDLGHVTALYTARPGQGLGKALMDRAKAGRDGLFLMTHEPNLGARRFYAREGFAETARLEPEPPETVREIRMEWAR